jgi:hypothetical protein
MQAKHISIEDLKNASEALSRLFDYIELALAKEDQEEGLVDEF